MSSNSPTPPLLFCDAQHRRGAICLSYTIAFVQSRDARSGEDVAQHVERVLILAVEAHRRPLDVQPRNLDAILERQALLAGQRRGAILGRVIGLPRGMSPKYFAIHAFACSGSKSPTITSVALFGA